MSVLVLKDHVFLPFAPDWQARPQIRRIWRSLVSESVTGAEARTLLVPKPRHAVRWTALALDAGGRANLVDSIRAAKASGLAAAPFWGRASLLLVPAAGDSLQLADEGWAWGKGDYAFLLGTLGWELATVTGVHEGVLALAGPLAATHGRLVWPILFGRFRSEEIHWLNLTHGAVTLEVEQREPFADPDTGPNPNDFYEFFETYLLGEISFPGVLVDGVGWAAAADLSPNLLATVGLELFESYAIGTAGVLDRGLGWVAAAGVSLNRAASVALETFETYNTGSVSEAALGGGTGWADVPDLL